MKWENLTSPQLAKLDRRTPVVMNIGAIEQHGAHLPLVTDALIGRYFTDMVDERLGAEVLTLPQVAVCCSQHHMDFVGTLTVRHETLLQYVCDILESVVAHGFTNIVLFNSHGGNLAIGQVIVEKLGGAHPSVNFFMMTWWKIASEKLAVVQESEFGGVGHACEFETSLLLHFAPELVDPDHIRDTPLQTVHAWADTDLLNAPKASHHRTMADLTDGTGVYGAPSYASADKGARIAGFVIEEMKKILLEVAKTREKPSKKGVKK